jgi:hypothetical protein
VFKSCRGHQQKQRLNGKNQYWKIAKKIRVTLRVTTIIKGVRGMTPYVDRPPPGWFVFDVMQAAGWFTSTSTQAEDCGAYQRSTG